MRPRVITQEIAGQGIVAHCHWPLGVGNACVHGRAFVPFGNEVGRFGSRLKKAARAVARSKVLRGIARTAANVAKQTPYGQAAAAALNVARSAARAARGERRNAAAEARGSRALPSRTSRGRGRAYSSLSDAQRLALVREYASSRGPLRYRMMLIQRAAGA